MRLIDADVVREKLMQYIGLTNGFDRAFSETPTIQTKQVKYFDEDEKVWKIGSVIVDGEREGE